VSAAIQSLLKSARIDEAIGLNAVLLDAAKTSLSPTFMRARLRPKTQSAFTDQLAMVVLAQHGVGKTVDHVAVGSAPAGNETPALGYISFATEIAEVDWRAVPTEEEVVCPYTIDEKISVFFSRNGLLEKIEPVSLWPEGNNIEQAKSAIDCCVARLVSYGTSEKARVRYEIGARFLQSAEKWECGQQGRHNFTLIESCARIVLGVPKHEIGEFRDNFTGEQKVRSDGALAYRTHVTKRGAGLRLMFWRRPGGPIEFANVGDKDELVIE
jgi:hypothetical protein